MPNTGRKAIPATTISSSVRRVGIGPPPRWNSWDLGRALPAARRLERPSHGQTGPLTGIIDHVGYVRDPLSAEYDPVARELIGTAIGRARRVLPARRWVDAIIPYPDDLPTLAAHDQGPPDWLNAWERAFQRSLYHDDRIHKPRRNKGGPWSLEVRWGPVPAADIFRRTFAIRLWPDTSGARHAAALPTSESWVDDPDLRSGAPGSGRERFPG